MADIDERICKILAQMIEKKPAGQIISAAVAIKILEGKFKAAFGGIDFNEKSALITKYLADHQSAAPTQSAAPAKTATKAAASESDSDDSDDSADIEEDEEDDEEDESIFDDSESEADEEEPAAKKLRTELLTGDAGARVDAMLTCARKVGYRPKAIVADQTPEAYLTEYLIPFFEGKGMDATKFGEEDIKRYRKIKEVAELERDGANLALDRSSRRGRGVVAPIAPAAPKPSFMDDE